MRLRRAAAALALAAVAAPAAALAGHLTTLSDRDDSAGAADLARVRAAHNRADDRLVYVVDFHGPISPATLLSEDGPPGSVCVNVWTTRTPGESPPNYDACVTADARGRAYRASVARHSSRGAVTRVGAASVAQPSERRLELRIDPDALRRPRSVRWTLQAVAFGSGCPRTTGCEDFVPDRPSAARTRIARPPAR